MVIEAEYCPHCEQKIKKLNPHSMCKQKVNTLAEVAMLNISGVEWVKIQRDHRRIPVDDRHRTLQQDEVYAMRLRWFGLLDSRGNRSGEVKVNELGFQFLAGKLSIPATIHCRDGEVVKVSDDRVYISDVNKVVYDKTYWDNYWREQT